MKWRIIQRLSRRQRAVRYQALVEDYACRRADVLAYDQLPCDYIDVELEACHDELANHGDGTFGKWCSERCGMSKRAAYNYLGATEVFAGQKQLDRASLAQTFTAESLYYLSREVTPEAAIKDALKAAKKGARVTLAKEKEKREGARDGKTGSTVQPVSILSDLGITKTQSHRWQTNHPATASTSAMRITGTV